MKSFPMRTLVNILSLLGLIHLDPSISFYQLCCTINTPCSNAKNREEIRANKRKSRTTCSCGKLSWIRSRLIFLQKKDENLDFGATPRTD